MPRKNRSIPQSRITDSGQIIQFRADDQFVDQLAIVADRLKTPIGVLARQWVAERLSQELIENTKANSTWRADRLKQIQRKLKFEMLDGPAQIIQLVPLSQQVSINLEEARKQVTFLAPVERVDNRYSARINVHGFITEKTFAMHTKSSGYVQLFRTGQLESVRILHAGVDKGVSFIYGDQLDDDLLRVVWSYSLALAQLKVPLPIDCSISFAGINAYCLRTAFQERAPWGIDVDTFELPRVQIQDWSQISKIEHVANLLKPALNVLWNAAGFERSFSYDANGQWCGAKHRI